jgi:UDPglucose 6-dehydrogenase/GDP-mannose 6-dehydrogenase
MIVTIIGTGYVGLVTGACLGRLGHRVRCVDVSEDRLNTIRAGKSPFYEPGLDELLHEVLSDGRLSVTANLAEAMDGSELSLIAVGTPAKGEDPDLSFIETAAAQIGALLSSVGHYHVVAVKSTVVPGTTRNIVWKSLEKASGLKLGDFGVCMNPEFLREGSAVDDFADPDRIVIGQADSRSGEVMLKLYEAFDCEKIRVSLEEAELTKYSCNSLLSVLISFSNELAALCEATPGADVETVMQGLHADKRLAPILNGKRIKPEILGYLRAGIGFGGSCLPKDVNALRVYGKRTGVLTPMLDATISTNVRRPEQVVAMAEAAMGSLAGKTVALLGVAFKPGTDDLRSSPALAIFDVLEKRGALVQAYDRFISAEAAKRAGLKSFHGSNLEAAVTGADAAFITTVDPLFRAADWAALTSVMKTPVVIDGRNVLRNVSLPESVRYIPIGKRTNGTA